MYNETTFPVTSFKRLETPFYYYDTKLLNETLKTINKYTAENNNFVVHYAIKANHNQKILEIIQKAGIGVDAVSANEIKCAIAAGFNINKIVFAGVGKTDKEIEYAIANNIFCFNVESEPELERINEIASEKGKTVNIAFRVNPNINAHTHKNITTGLSENKFGISPSKLYPWITLLHSQDNPFKNVKFIGLHFHIGSQILDNTYFIPLCEFINSMTKKLADEKVIITYINVGGGLGIDYANPNDNSIPNFKDYFNCFKSNLIWNSEQTLHFELGRSIVGQCGNLISSVTYIKQGDINKFAVIDAGMTELIRPALYNAYHQIENISRVNEKKDVYDIVGPICESSDTFGKGVEIGTLKRGDYIAIRSAGAYGESMASRYNWRDLVVGYLDSEIEK